MFATVNDTMGIVLEVKAVPGAKMSDGADWSSLLRVKLVTGEERWIGSWDPLIITSEDNMIEEDMNELEDFLYNKGTQ